MTLGAVSLRFAYGAAPADPVLRRVTLSLPPGSRTLIAGVNGSGKSTLGLVLAGLLPAADPGSLCWNDIPLAALPVATRVARIQIVGQRADLHLSGRAASVLAEVAFGPENLGLPPSEVAARSTAALADMGLTHLAEADPRHLSGGETQRLAIAGALALRPRLLILDEPLTDLDLSARAALTRRLAALDDGMSVLILDTGARHWPREFFTAYFRLHDGCLHRADTIPAMPERPKKSRPAEGTDLLAVRDLHFSRRGVAVLSGVNFTVQQGACLALTGPNGAGKTTLLRLIAGLERPAAGQIDLVGVTPSTASARKLAEGLGIVFQNADRQFTASTIGAEAALAPRLLRQSAPQDRALAALEAVGLSPRASNHPFDLDNGARRLAALAAALSHGPQLLLLDETQRGLDETHLAQLENRMHAHCAEGGAVMFVCHDRDFVARNAHTRLELIGGKVLCE